MTIDTATRTVYIRHATRYYGEFTDATITPHEDGVHFLVKGGGGMVYAKGAEIHDTEADAKAAIKALRAPRTKRSTTPLYGDYAMLAAMNGIRTDGTGRKAR